MCTLIGSAKNRPFRVFWMLEEMGIPYAYVSASPHSETVNKYYPSGKIPILLDGDAVITDPNAIMTYLADKHAMMTEKAELLLERIKTQYYIKLLTRLMLCFGPLQDLHWVSSG